MNFIISKIGFISFIIFTVIFVEGCGFFSHPSDQILEQRLRSHESEFNRLVVMLFEDSDIVRLSNENVFLSEGNRHISDERLREYRHLFDELNLEKGIHRDGVNIVRLIASSKGLFLAYSEKSYVYSKSELNPIVNSLDEIISRDRGDQSTVYRKLKDNWYLYYASW